MTRQLSFACGLVLMFVGCDGNKTDSDTKPEADLVQSAVDIEGLRPQINAFCGDCHATPDPKTFPRNAWFKEVEQGYNFYYKSKRKDLKMPAQADVVAWYRAQADEQLLMPIEENATAKTTVAFRRDQLSLPASVSFPAVSHVYSPAVDSTEGTAPTFFLDMYHGQVCRLVFEQNKLDVLEMLPAKTVAHPAHIERTDLNSDGEPDYVFAELGSYPPQDHSAGKVLWFDPKSKRTESLLSNVGRVADVRPVDVDADGDLDLIVAEFGWLETGSILLLRQTSSVDGVPKFEPEQIDDRHGTIHVPVVDLNRDGHPDFVALISQEHERIEGFINDGQGKFTKQVIFNTDNPSYGSSGIELIDLDGDGDLDVLYTNGDTLDGHYLKPYHGIQWLENLGDVKFEHRVIKTMAGVYRAVAADFDNDGDLDIVAGAHISSALLQTFSADVRFDSLIWLEQTKRGEFARHPIAQVRQFGYYALNVNDLDGDGDLDIIAGNHASPTSQHSSWVDVFWNQLK